jgi:hypothetical protein
LREVDPEGAVSINASIPFAREPNPAARPFKIEGGDAAYNRALECLSAAIYYEADGETADGQRAVAQVVLNRVRHPAFTQSVCAAVYHGSMRRTGCQFSFTCDGSMRRRPTASGWARSRAIAEQALAGAVFKPVGYATHYHADYVVPYWATSLAKNAVLGTHIFYRWPGWWGQPPAFAKRHSGEELDPRLLRDAALRRFGVRAEHTRWDPEELVLETDSRVELMSIIQFLAAGSAPGEQPQPYEDEVRKHFSGYSEHVAVQIYRQLSAGESEFNSDALLKTVMHYSEPPQLETRDPLKRELIEAIGGRRKLMGFISALRDFVKHTGYEGFLQDRQSFYTEFEAKARQPTLALIADVERDTGTPLHTRRFILAPLLSSSTASACQDLQNGVPGAWVIVGVRDTLQLAPEQRVQLKDALGPCHTSQ